MKKFISGLLGIIFVIFVVCGIFICTYVFSSPDKSTDSESRQLIRGYWTDTKNKVVLEFSTEGDFKMVHLENDDPDASLKNDNAVIAKGYFKIDEDDKKIKLLILPFGKDESVDLGENLFLFSTLTYRDLEYPEEDKTAVAFRNNKIQKEEEKGTCKFIVSNSTEVYNCERTVTVEDFYDGKSK